MREITLKVENVALSIRKLKAGNEVSKSKQSGEIVVNGSAFPFIMIGKSYGRIKDMVAGSVGTVSLISSDQPKTKYTKKGYFALLLNFNYSLIRVYIKEEKLKDIIVAMLFGGN